MDCKAELIVAPSLPKGATITVDFDTLVALRLAAGNRFYERFYGTPLESSVVADGPWLGDTVTFAELQKALDYIRKKHREDC